MLKTISGALLGTAMAVGFVLPADAASAKDKTLVMYNGTNGEDIFSSLIQGSDGNIYGTTVFGGANANGTIFQLTSAGKYNILYSFCSQSNCTDGANGEWLTEGADGNFCGETYTGGNANDGTIFEITPSGQFTSLYSFCAQTNCTDGKSPQSALIQTSDGTFWGTTTSGGTYNHGTIFKFTPGQSPAVVYSFCPQSGCYDGAFPYTGLTLASDGNFYGVTAEGGNNAANCPLESYGCGTVFRMTTSGTLTTIYTFCTQSGCPDGEIPQGQLIQAKDGDLYGTTDGGGSQYSGGTTFKINLQGKLTTLHVFCASGECSDGVIPYAGVIQGKDKSIYGTTDLGGPNGWGSIYQITPHGKFGVVYSFDQTDGAAVAAGLLQAKNGKFYGGTTEGGNTGCANGCGVLYRVTQKTKHASDDHVPAIARIPSVRRAVPLTPLGPVEQ